MPGNEIGDRVHNFFPQGSLPQELHLSPALGSNWPVSSDSPWAGNQRQVSLGSPNVKNYNLQQSDGERGQIGNHLHGQNDFPQLTLRPEFGNNNQSPAQPSNVNGFWGDRDTNHNHHNLGSRGLPNYGSQQQTSGGGPENQTKSSVRATGNPGSSLGFDLFGGQGQQQQPMNSQQLSMLQSLRHQLSGNDMQQLQQQVMFMKMQELQRQQQQQQQQQQLQQQQQASGSHFLAMNNGSQSADVSSNNLGNNEQGTTNRMQQQQQQQRSSPYMLAFSPNHSPGQSTVDVHTKQNEQSLYGVPVSGGSRGGVLNQYSHMTTTDNRPAQQQASFGSSQFNASPSQFNVQNGNSFAKQRFQVENSFGQQAPSPARAENFQQQRNSPHEEFHRMQRDVVVQDNNLMDTTEMQSNTSSQGDVALDPTEERILFGSDDNIWSAFGKSQEDGNAFDGGAFSALMQSAVAETSGGDSGLLKEEGSGLNFQLGNEHVRASNDGGRQAPFASSLNSGFGTGSNDMNMNKNYQKVLGFPQFGDKSSNSPQGLGHSSQEGGGQWSNGVPGHNFLAEASMAVHRNSAHSVDSDFGKNVPGSWRPENLAFQRTPSKQDGGDAFGSMANYRDGDVMAMQREVPHVGAPWTLDSSGDPNMQVKISGRNNDGFGDNNNNHSKILDSSIMRTGQGNSSNYPINNWKFVDPLVNSKANETIRNMQHHDNNATLYNDLSKGNEMENSDNNQENSNDSRRSSMSHHASTGGGQRTNVYSDAIDSRTKSSTMHNNKYNQTDLKSHNYPMGGGDLGDVEPPSRGMKQPQPSLHSQSMAHFSQPKFFGQMPNNNFVETGKGPLDNNQRSSSSSTKAFNEVLSHPPGSSVMASGPNMPSPFNRIGDTKATNMASMSSQNMLELLHKVDQSGGEHCPATHTSSSHPSSSSELHPPAEKSDGSVGQLQRSLSSHSQGFSLQLGPPQRPSIPNQFMQVTNSTQSSYGGVVDTGHDGSSSSSVPPSVHIMPSSRVGNEVHKVPGNFNSSFHSREKVQTLETVSRPSEKEGSISAAQKWDPPHVRPSSHPSAETSLPKSEPGSFLDNNNALLSGNNNASVEYGANLPDKVSLPTSITGLTSQGPVKGLSGSWTNIVAQQHLMGHQFRKHLPQSFQTMRVNNSDSLAYMNQLDQDNNNTIKRETEFANNGSLANTQGYGGPAEEDQSMKGGGMPRQQVWPEYNTNNLATQKENASHGKMVFEAPANSLSTQSDNIEAFGGGRSLKPNHFQQNLSMLNPLRGHIVAPMARLPDDCSEMVSDATVPLNNTGHSGDTNINFSGPINNTEKKPSLEHGNAATSQGLLAFGHMVVSQGSNDDSVPPPVDHHHSNIISSRQMGPSLFINQYEALRNEQVSPGVIAKSTEQQPLSGGAVDNIGVNNKVACIQQSDHPPPSCMDHVSSQILPMDVGDQHHPTVLSGAKKRKSVPYEPMPWCKEVSQGSGNLQTISMAEVEWSKAVNRKSQKVEEDVEFLHDGPPFIRSRRRLILTTQLMQQLLRPPHPPSILSMDANSDYESVAYSVSRLALGEACNNMVAPTTTNEESNTSTTDGMNRVSGECKTSDQFLLKAAEAFTARARKLESDFSRVCKGASLVDMFVDYQDVEKFSTINRFAKFYGRGPQAENNSSETSSSSSSSDATNMQRYVIAVPLPRTLPTGVQCHSL